jgi:hypothetical protein
MTHKLLTHPIATSAARWPQCRPPYVAMPDARHNEDVESDLEYARRVAQAHAGESPLGPDEITTAGIAALGRVSPSAVSRWTEEPSFPEPLRAGVFPLAEVQHAIFAGHLLNARRVAREQAGPYKIDDDEITTRGAATLAGVDTTTITRWGKDPDVDFPSSLRKAVYPLEPVVRYLMRRAPVQKQPGPDSLITLYQFAQLRGLADMTVIQYADHPHLKALWKESNVNHRGAPLWPRAELDNFWDHVRIGRGRTPRRASMSRSAPTDT